MKEGKGDGRYEGNKARKVNQEAESREFQIQCAGWG